MIDKRRALFFLIFISCLVFFIGGVYGFVIEEEKNLQNADSRSFFPEFERVNENFLFDKDSQETFFGAEYKGYIIEFEDKSIVRYKLDLEEEVKENQKYIEESFFLNPKRIYLQVSGVSSEKIDTEVEKYKLVLESKSERIKNKILFKVGDGKKIKSEFNFLFNGISLEVSDDEVKEIEKIKGVKKVWPNVKVKATLMDSVPLIQGGIPAGMLSSTGNYCEETGEECLTGEGIKIAIIDTGVDYTHPDLGGCLGAGCKIIGGYDIINQDNDPMDDQGHGTHVAATAAGNGVLKGVAPDANILAYKVLDNEGSGSWSSVLEGIERAVLDDVDIISMSLGGPGNPDDPISTAVDNAVNLGVVAVIAAGNLGPYENTIRSPGTARKAITIGATDKQDKIAMFSSRGPVAWWPEENSTQILLKPDIIAPGVSICAAQASNNWLSDRECLDDRHISISGTSMATPHVAGAVALLKQKNPDWTPEEIKMVLRNAAFKIEQSIFAQGYGRVDVLNSLNFEGIPSLAVIDTGGLFEEEVDIFGTATGRDFSEYELSYSKERLQNWILIKNDTTPVEEGILYENFDISKLVEGKNYLKLSVWNTKGEISEDFNMLFVDNMRIDSPPNDGRYRPESQLNISGTVKGNFDHFFIEYSPSGVIGGEWTSEAITLVGGGKNEIIDGLLGVWNASSIEDGDYLLRIRSVMHDGENSSEIPVTIYFDSYLREGWPIEIVAYSEEQNRIESNTIYVSNKMGEFISSFKIIENSSYKFSNTKGEIVAEVKNNENGININNLDDSVIFSNSLHSLNPVSYWLGPTEPVVDDVNKDGKKEIFTYVGGNPTKIYAFNENGSNLEGWPVEVEGTNLPGGNLGPVSIADFNGDGYKEIIVNGGNLVNLEDVGLFIYYYNGTLYKKISLPITSQPTTATVLSDLNGDGRVEIIRKYDSFSEPYIGDKLAILDSERKMLPGWPKIIYDKRSPDGLGLFSCSGLLKYESSPIIANLDEDEDYEIVVGAMRNVFDDPNNLGESWHCEGRLYAFNLDGSEVPGFPKDLDGRLFSTPISGDINNDGYDEVILGTINSGIENYSQSGIYAFDKNGNVLSGWPQYEGESFWNFGSLFDREGDNFLEIVIDFSPFSIFDWTGNLLFSQNYGVSNSVIGKLQNNNSFIFKNVLFGSFPGVDSFNFENGVSSEGFPKSLPGNSMLSSSDLDLNGKIEFLAGTGSLFGNSFIYVWDSNISDSFSMGGWPQFQHDAQHTGCYNCNEFPSSSRIVNNQNVSINGQLSISIQRKVGLNWTFYQNVVINESVELPPQGFFDIRELFNSQNVSINQSGKYRIYGIFEYSIQDSNLSLVKTNFLMNSSMRVTAFEEFNIGINSINTEE